MVRAKLLTKAQQAYIKHPDAILLLITKGDGHPYKDYISKVKHETHSYKSQNKCTNFDPLLTDTESIPPPTYLVYHHKNEYTWVGKCEKQKLSKRETASDNIAVCNFRLRTIDFDKVFPRVELDPQARKQFDDTQTQHRIIKRFLAEHNFEIISGQPGHGIILVKKNFVP